MQWILSGNRWKSTYMSKYMNVVCTNNYKHRYVNIILYNIQGRSHTRIHNFISNIRLKTEENISEHICYVGYVIALYLLWSKKKSWCVLQCIYRIHRVPKCAARGDYSVYIHVFW